MKKKDEKLLTKMIKDSMGDSYKDCDQILIQELVDWISIQNKAKEDLQKEVKADGEMGWQSLTTISMCSKAIQSCLKNLGLTPVERTRQKVEQKGSAFDIQKFLSEN